MGWHRLPCGCPSVPGITLSWLHLPSDLIHKAILGSENCHPFLGEETETQPSAQGHRTEVKARPS